MNKQLYHKGNNGKGVLIIHGFTAPIEDTDIYFNYLKRKDYTIIRPILSGHCARKNNLHKFGPNDWLKELSKHLEELAKAVDEIFIIGSSFGGNLGICLAKNNSKVNGLILVEAPVIFNLKFDILSIIIQPLAESLGITHVKKSNALYRSNYKKKDDCFFTNYVPLKCAGLINKFVRKHTKKHIRDIDQPCFIVQAIKSDLLSSKNAEYIFSRIKSKKKEIYYVPIDNHDLNLLDDEGKIIMLERIYRFIKKQ